MSTQKKIANLRKHKLWATGLFVFMLITYIICIYLNATQVYPWVNYVKAFSEAAMVGALADWFAVTALFRYPLGIKIPHTNIIQNSKDAIGENLGSFVVENFINPTTIKPYIKQIKVNEMMLQWLKQDQHQQLLVSIIKQSLNELIKELDAAKIQAIIVQQSQILLQEIKLNEALGKGIQYFLEREEYHKAVSQIATKIAGIIADHDDILKNKVKENSYFFIPGFVNNKIADKITQGIMDFLIAIAQQPDHAARKEITNYLWDLSEEIKNEEQWNKEIYRISNEILSEDTLLKYTQALWNYGIKKIETILSEDNVTFEHYASPMMKKWLAKWEDNLEQQERLDIWVQKKIYTLLLHNREEIGKIISTTVNKWDSKELSEKLELEVGKDLQFIRINGTLVGGIVGLFIYTVTQLFIS